MYGGHYMEYGGHYMEYGGRILQQVKVYQTEFNT